MNYLGSGIVFPFKVDSSGCLQMKSDEPLIEQSIRLILSTRAFERVMRPNFGSGLSNFVFKSVTDVSLMLIKKSVEEALVEFEPRINVLKVSAAADALISDLVQIEIEYQIRNGQAVNNLVYPFYLGGEYNAK